MAFIVAPISEPSYPLDEMITCIGIRELIFRIKDLPLRSFIWVTIVNQNKNENRIRPFKHNTKAQEPWHVGWFPPLFGEGREGVFIRQE